MGDSGHYSFLMDGKFYLYDFIGGVITEISDNFYDIIKRYDKNEVDDVNEAKFINTLLSCGLLQKMKDIPQHTSYDDKVAYLTFAPTYKCNFRCTYCFGEHGDKYSGNEREFTKESLLKMLKYFFEVAFPQAEQYRIDFVSGGEPLLGFEIIKMAVAHIEEYTIQKKKQVSIWLCTNGALLTDDIIEYLSRHNISIGISIDGEKKYNDINRIDANGMGTYDRICKGIALIRNNKNVSEKFKCLWGLCTATNENCNFVEILNHMKQLGFSNVQIRLIRSNKNYDINKIITQYDRLSEFLIESYRKGDLTYLKMILNDNDQFGKILKRIILNAISIRRCDAGINKITICPDGTIYPCDSLVGIHEFTIGNINNKNKRDKMKIDINKIRYCKNCDIKYLCGGDCYFNSYMKTGSVFEPDSEFCKIQRYLLELAIVLRYKMETMNNDLYNALSKEVKIKNDYTELFG